MSMRSILGKFIVLDNETSVADDKSVKNATVQSQQSAPHIPPVLPPVLPPPPAIDMFDSVRVEVSSVLPPPPPPQARATHVPTPGLDLADVYLRAGIQPMAFMAEQAAQMLAELPAELPVETKRQTVRAMLQAMSQTTGVTPAILADDAVRKIAAIEAEVGHVARQVADYATTLEMEINALAAQISERKRNIDAARQDQSQLASQYKAESERLASVARFFGASRTASR